MSKRSTRQRDRFQRAYRRLHDMSESEKAALDPDERERLERHARRYLHDPNRWHGETRTVAGTTKLM